MPKLTISTGNQALGPLSVEVLATDGLPFGRPLNLSSVRQEVEVDNLPIGEYTVVATRPSGEKLVASGSVGPRGGHAMIATTGDSPHEYLSEAARLGLIYTTDSPTHGKSDLRQTALQSVGLEGAATRTIGTLLRSKIHTRELDFQSDLERLHRFDRQAQIEEISASIDYLDIRRLVQWRLDGGRWHPTQIEPNSLSLQELKEPSDYLRINLSAKPSPYNEDEASRVAVAFGLLNERGFGPIVIVPYFTYGIDVTFLAAGTAMEEHASRAGNPSAVRVPVAIAVPHQASLADLLVAINAPLFPSSNELFQDVRSDVTERAINFFDRKYHDPAAAVLGATFLARFAPEQLSLEWLQNLNRLLPDIADSWVLLAIATIAQGGKQSVDLTVANYLRRAVACRCTLFNRSRLSLNRLALRYGPFPRSRQDEVSTPRRPRTGDFLDFSAEAGGLESFWGYSPTRPGNEGRNSHHDGLEIQMLGGKLSSLY